VAGMSDCNNHGTNPEPDRDELRRLLALAERVGPRAQAPDDEHDPQVLTAVRRQRRVAAVLQSGGPATPESLRTRVDQLYGGRGGTSRIARLGLFAAIPLRLAGAATVAAAAVVVAVLLATGGSSTRPAATRVAQVWTLPATGRDVAANPSNPAALAVSFHGTAYPNYHDSEGWHAVGTRTDRVAGTSAFTVYYATGQRRAAYTVVADTQVSVPAGARRFKVDGVRLAEFRDGDRWVIVFPDRGNSCVLTAAAPREKQWLVKLAVWHRVHSATPA
jgi:hypothetical protein